MQTLRYLMCFWLHRGFTFYVGGGHGCEMCCKTCGRTYDGD